MPIGPVELNTAMTRIQDFASQKHNEDQRGAVQQNHFQNRFQQEVSQDMRQVVKTDQSEYQNRAEYQNKRFDARDKGSNEYAGDGGQKRKKEKPADGKVVVKQKTGFDIKI